MAGSLKRGIEKSQDTVDLILSVFWLISSKPQLEFKLCFIPQVARVLYSIMDQTKREVKCLISLTLKH